MFELSPPPDPRPPQAEPEAPPSAMRLIQWLAAGEWQQAEDHLEEVVWRTNGVPVELEVALLLALTAPIPKIVARALWGLGRFERPSTDTLYSVIQCLSHPEATVRTEAAETLGHWPASVALALNSLLNLAANDESMEVRRWAIHSIAVLAKPDHFEKCQGTLLAVTRNELLCEMVRAEASEALVRFGEQNPTFAAALAERQVA